MAASPRPTPMDLSLHGATRDWPLVPLTVGTVLDVAGDAPPVGRLRDHVAAHLDRLPVLTHHLRGPRLRARWVRDPGPGLEVRVRELEVPPGGLEAAVETVTALPLPETGPPWDLWLLHGHAAGTYTLCYRAAHTTHDGGAIRNTLYALFGDAPPQAPVPARASAAACGRALRGQAGALARSGVWDDPAVPLSGERLRSWVSVPTARLREAAAPAGGSANDALLACLAQALGDWAAEHWPRGAGRPLSAMVMVDGRSTGEAARPGNLFALAPLRLPAHLPDFEGRLAAVTAATTVLRRPSERAALRLLTERAPARAFYAAATLLTTPARATVDTSHVAFRRPLRHEGAPVTAVRIFTWLPPRHPLSLVSCAYAGVTTVNFVTDAALPGIGGLPQRWSDALEATGRRGDDVPAR